MNFARKSPNARRFLQRRIIHCVGTILLMAFATGPVSPVAACTTAVISGRVTIDGRPILWKNRDTSHARNEVILLTEGPLRAIAIVNAGSKNSVWMGVNAAGFCIENSLSTDLDDDERHQGPSNGPFMKRALLHCRTVEDFRALLEETNQTGRRTVANFGVIDAQGGAAMFETSATEFAMFDANDPEVAPHGYIVRSNFATTAQDLPANPTDQQVAEIRSGERYLRGCQLLDDVGPGRISHRYVLRNLTRDLADEAGMPFSGTINGGGMQLPGEIQTASTISRTTTVSAAVFVGVRPDEDPQLTTMWAILGDPKFSIAVPCWVNVDSIADPLTDDHGGEIGEAARTLRDAALLEEGNGISTELLPGIWTDLWPLEDQLLERTEETLSTIRRMRRSLQPRPPRPFDSTATAKSRASKTDPTATNRDVLTDIHHALAHQAWLAMQQEIEEAKHHFFQRDTFTATSRDWPTTEAIVRVAIYDASSGTAKGPRNLLACLTTERGFACNRVNAEQIREGNLRDFDVLIMPGGSGSGQAKSLGDEGSQAIKDFVQDGGGYVGICAGSYLASSHYRWSLHLINARVWDRAHWARGNGPVRIQLTSPTQPETAQGGKELKVQYGQGPLMLPDDEVDLPAYEVVATYTSEVAMKGALEDVMNDTHAIIRSSYGRGRVICFSPHPEVPDGPHELIIEGVRWAKSVDE